MNFFFITNSCELAKYAVENGADRIFVDLEIIGKQARQGHLNTVISRHTLPDVVKIRSVVPKGSLLVRVNPIHAGSAEEIEKVIQAGADTIMLPMFHSPREVGSFIGLVAGRARTTLLVETVGAMNSLHECVAVEGVDEVHIGLNDLHLEIGNRFMFEPLSDGLVDGMAKVLNDAEIPFGFGGVARVGEGQLPAEMILAEHARLGSSAAILSRTFHRQAKTVAELVGEMDFKAEILKLRNAFLGHLQAEKSALLNNQIELNKRIRKISASLAAKDSSNCA